MSALFLPLKTEYYRAFESGAKTEELRLYGKRWNESVCRIGREVILSKGYGKSERLVGVITSFKKQSGHTFGLTYKQAIMGCYETLDVEIACFGINVTQVDRHNKQ